jgi:hypothetical protein
VQDNFSTHEFVRWLQTADTCDVAAPERGPVAVTDVARVSTILISYLIRQGTSRRLFRWARQAWIERQSKPPANAEAAPLRLPSQKFSRSGLPRRAH